jgi:cytochrome b561
MSDPTHQTPRYALGQRVIHWAVAVMVICVLSGGLLLGILGFKGVTEVFGASIRNFIYTYHKTFGLIILAAMIIRLGMRIRQGAPPYEPPLEPWQRVMSGIVHKLLYVGLLAMPILGWLATDASEYPVEFFAWSLPQFIAKDQALGALLYDLHGIVGWAVTGLLALHIGAAMMHWLIKRDRVMSRISLWPSKPSSSD